MDNKKKTMLRSLSNLNDDVVEKQTAKRIQLLEGLHKKRRNKRLFITIGSMAASLALIATAVVLLVNVLTKQVPIYTGMTVSAAEETDVLYAEQANGPRYNADAINKNGSLAGDFTGREAPASFGTLGDVLDLSDGTPDMYYAKPNETVLVTVHFDNPDDFEILSFTLNGEKYASHMFRDGSDMENIIVEVNVGSAAGVVEYTIDAIKYVDGTKIKDVRMDGDRTVRIGVWSDEQPAATVGALSVGFDSVSFSVSASDTLELVEKSEGKLQALLYDGTEIVARKELSPTEGTSVTFDTLAFNKKYEIVVIGEFDALDGRGKTTHVLQSKAFYTKAPVLFTNVMLGTTTLDFGLLFDTQSGLNALYTLALYQGTSKVRDIATTATEIADLAPNTAYRLVGTFASNGSTEQIELSFTTKPLVYTVKHLLENLDGTYTLAESSEQAMTPGETFAPVPLTKEGFVTPAADSKLASTTDQNPVIEYRYARASFAVAFLNGGAQTNDTLKFGAPLPTPTKPSCNFLGWFDAWGNRHVTMPATPITLTAQWSGELSATDLFYSGSAEITITGIKNLAYTDVVLPAYIDGGRVVGIGQNAFKNQTQLRSITLPASITSVGVDAFAGCTNLEKVYFDGTLAGWCNITFAENESVDYVADDDGYLYYPAARYLSNPLAQGVGLYLSAAPTVNVLTGTLVLPTEPLTGKNCFAGSSLTAIEIPAEATAAFRNVIFAACYELETIYFNATNMADGHRSDNYCGMIGGGWHSDGVSLYIGANVTRMPGGRPFDGIKLVAVEFAPYSACTAFGESAFLTSEPGGYVVNFCTELLLPEHLETVAREGCTGFKYITELTLPASLRTIGEDAFRNMYALETLTLPTTVTEIGSRAFANMSSLQTLYYNAHATLSAEQSDAVFTGMGSLLTLGTTVVIGASVTVIPTQLFGTTLSHGSDNKIASLSFAAGSVCTEIRAYAFADCDLAAITLPEGLDTIGQQAFSHCRGLAEITLPAGVSVGSGAFQNCTYLTTVTLPADIGEIDLSAFNGCTAITDVYFGGDETDFEALGLFFAGEPTIHYSTTE